MSQDYVEQIAVAIMKVAARLVKHKLFSRTRPNAESAQASNSTGNSSDKVLKQNSTSERSNDEQTATSEQSTTQEQKVIKREVEQNENVEGGKSNSNSYASEESGRGEDGTNESADTRSLEQIDGSGEVESTVIESDSRPEGVEDENDEIPAHSSILFHFSIFLVWVIVTALNIPVALTWARNFR